jgi:hypothetical protein
VIPDFARLSGGPKMLSRGHTNVRIIVPIELDVRIHSRRGTNQ